MVVPAGTPVTTASTISRTRTPLNVAPTANVQPITPIILTGPYPKTAGCPRSDANSTITATLELPPNNILRNAETRGNVMPTMAIPI
ncbi:hypothetical protein MnTg02_00495 [bacterium MnTg02]|nr:hypothetical protein MnTg02_00495 [bacterium MnTg02]